MYANISLTMCLYQPFFQHEFIIYILVVVDFSLYYTIFLVILDTLETPKQPSPTLISAENSGVPQ